MSAMTLDHIGIAVKDLDAALQSYEAFGLTALKREVVPNFHVEVCMIPLGETKLELIRPTSPDSAIAKFLEKRGEGVHHIALGVPNIKATLAQLKAQGFRLIDEVPRPGFGGHLVAFVHPHSTHGVLIELVERL